LDSARKAAYLVLRDVEENKAYSGLALKSAIRKVPPESAAFTRELVYGTIRKQILFDYLIGSFIKTPVGKLPVSDRVLLRMGLSQLSALDSVPDYAAVSETVELAKRYSRGREKFINGVLRNYIREKDNVVFPKPDEDEVRYLSLKYSFSTWIVKMLMDEYNEFRYVEMILDSLNQKPKFCIRACTLNTTPEELKESMESLGYTVIPDDDFPDIFFIEGTFDEKPLETDLYKKGMFSVQDKASRIAAYSLGAKEGDLVIDVCAGPGGKTMAIAESMNNSGRIVAMDIHEHRIRLIEAEAERLGIGIIDTVKWDAREINGDLVSKADLVLADVPCSGLGTARRKPEVKYKEFDEAMKSLPDKQLEILTASAEYVKAGGSLVYSTCTIGRRENRDVTDAFLAKNKEFELTDMIQLMPVTGKTDGFYICKLKRTGTVFGGKDAK
jgi:16S rRNA (cytosine967-C5)-methyltransferase